MSQTIGTVFQKFRTVFQIGCESSGGSRRLLFCNAVPVLNAIGELLRSHFSKIEAALLTFQGF